MLGAPNVRFSGAIEQQSGGRSNSFDFLQTQKKCLVGRKSSDTFPACHVPWCNGSTTGFGPVSQGSSPCGTTTSRRPLNGRTCQGDHAAATPSNPFGHGWTGIQKWSVRHVVIRLGVFSGPLGALSASDCGWGHVLTQPGLAGLPCDARQWSAFCPWRC